MGGPDHKVGQRKPTGEESERQGGKRESALEMDPKHKAEERRGDRWWGAKGGWDRKSVQRTEAERGRVGWRAEES